MNPFQCLNDFLDQPARKLKAKTTERLAQIERGEAPAPSYQAAHWGMWAARCVTAIGVGAVIIHATNKAMDKLFDE